MNPQPSQSTTLWPASLVALLVALGTERLLGLVIPANAVNWLSGIPPSGNFIIIDGQTNFWPMSTLIRITSFALGGFVGAMMAKRASVRVAALFAFFSLVVNLTEEAIAPDANSMYMVYFWISAAPVGMCFGTMIAKFSGRAT